MGRAPTAPRSTCPLMFPWCCRTNAAGSRTLPRARPQIFHFKETQASKDCLAESRSPGSHTFSSSSMIVISGHKKRLWCFKLCIGLPAAQTRLFLEAEREGHTLCVLRRVAPYATDRLTVKLQLNLQRKHLLQIVVPGRPC